MKLFIPGKWQSCSMILALILSATILQAQVNYRSTATTIVIKGTSSLHDWDMKSEKGACTAVITFNGNTPEGISNLRFSVQANTLKSGRSALDNNAYKALGTSKHPTISFAADNGHIQASGNNLQLRIPGRLTISGVTKNVTLTATGKLNADKSITWSGSFPMEMLDYGVKPPSIMFGTINTGNKIDITFNLTMQAI